MTIGVYRQLFNMSNYLGPKQQILISGKSHLNPAIRNFPHTSRSFWSQFSKFGYKSSGKLTAARIFKPYTCYDIIRWMSGLQQVKPSFKRSSFKRSIWKPLLLIGIGAPLLSGGAYYAVSGDVTRRQVRVTLEGGVRLVRWVMVRNIQLYCVFYSMNIMILSMVSTFL